MKIVVDTNIVFTAILNPSAKIGQILMYGQSEEQIPFHFWHEAIPLVRDTDMDDIAFVVLAAYLNAKLWTGDKKLIAGLNEHGYEPLISTDEILQAVK